VDSSQFPRVILRTDLVGGSRDPGGLSQWGNSDNKLVIIQGKGCTDKVEISLPINTMIAGY